MELKSRSTLCRKTGLNPGYQQVCWQIRHGVCRGSHKAYSCWRSAFKHGETCCDKTRDRTAYSALVFEKLTKQWKGDSYDTYFIAKIPNFKSGQRKVWLNQLERGSNQKFFQYCLDPDGNILYLLAIQGHSGGTALIFQCRTVYKFLTIGSNFSRWFFDFLQFYHSNEVWLLEGRIGK